MAAYFWLNGPSAGNDTLMIADGSSALNTFDGLAGTDVFDFGYRVSYSNFKLTNNPDGSVTLSGASDGHHLNAKLINFESVQYLDNSFQLHTIDISNNTEPGPTTGNDTLTGTSGNDTIDGMAGDDSIDGGLGNDRLLGKEGNDTLIGNDGNDSIDGGTGADFMLGYAGNDTYIVDNAGDNVQDYTYSSSGVDAGGTELVKASITYSLGNFLEKLTLTGNKAIHGTGNTLANSLTGNKAANKLSGLGGNDTINGGLGNDTLTGGAGKDQLTGGSGRDVFDFNTTAESGDKVANRDQIKDFVSDLDRLDLSTIDANTASKGNQAFSAPITGGAFSGSFATPGELYFDSSKHILYGNTDGDPAPEFSLQLLNLATLSASDLIL